MFKLFKKYSKIKPQLIVDRIEPTLTEVKVHANDILDQKMIEELAVVIRRMAEAERELAMIESGLTNK